MRAVDQLHALRQRRQHSQRQHIHLENSHGIDVVLVPFDDGAVLHLAFSMGTNSHNGPRVMTMPPTCWLRWRGKPINSPVSRTSRRTVRSLRIESRFGKLLGDSGPECHQLRDLAICSTASKSQTQCFADIPHGRSATIADHLRRHSRPLAAVFLIEILDHFLSPFMFEVNVDIGRLIAGGADETLEEQVDLVGINRRDAQAIADRRIRRRAAPLTKNAPRAREANQIVNR